MPATEPDLVTVQKALGWSRRSLGWAKLEMLFGLGAVGLGSAWAGGHQAASFAPALIALGGYLTLAGHRSHLYDAMARQTAATWVRFTGSDGRGASESPDEGGA